MRPKPIGRIKFMHRTITVYPHHCSWGNGGRATTIKTAFESIKTEATESITSEVVVLASGATTHCEVTRYKRGPAPKAGPTRPKKTHQEACPLQGDGSRTRPGAYRLVHTTR